MASDSRSPGSQYDIFNPLLRSENDITFPQFALLPPELRDAIWELSLCRERFIRIVLTPPKASRKSKADDDDDDDGNPSEGTAKLRVIVRGRQVHTKFLRVNRESRRAALSFYRVRVPCRYKHDKRSKRGMLYVNPELDTLWITPGTVDQNDVHLLGMFLHDFRAHDPRGIGLQYLAMEESYLYKLHRDSAPASTWELLPAAKSDLLDRPLSSLRRVTFMALTPTDRRSGRSLCPIIKGHGSRPIMAAVPAFERIVDPRRIDDDLKRVFVGLRDPNAMVFLWHNLLERWQICLDQLEYRLIVTHKDSGPSITNRDRAIKWITEAYGRQEALERQVQEQRRQREEQADANREAQGLPPRRRALEDEGVRVPPQELEEDFRPAIGFWEFLVDVLGPTPTARQSSFRVRRRFFLDMSCYRPELCLARIPGG
jgi:hypothetical protein